MKTIKKTRRYFLKLMMSIISVIVIVALVAIYMLSYTNTEVNNNTRLSSLDEIRITSTDKNIDINDMFSDTALSEKESSDIGSHVVMVVNKEDILYKVTSIKGLSDSVFDKAKELTIQGESEGKIEINDRIWQYNVSPAELDISGFDEVDVKQLDDCYGIRLIDITESQRSLQMLLVSLSIIGIILLLLFFFFCLYFSKRATKPMVDVLEQQQQFIADASHELKTPISIIKANCGVLQANMDETIESQKEWLDNIKSGTDRMTQLIQNLITVAKIEDDTELIQSRISLQEIVEEVLYPLDLLIQDKKLEITINNIGDTTIYNDANLIHQVITIILDNAIKYSNSNGQINIVIKQEKKDISLAITNTGKGIPKEDINKIFHRFYRSEDARTQDGSYGLGLSIAATIMERINGKIIVDSIEDEWTTFTLRF
ncbi:MAG: sensor histidine kinase [Coprobacillaceae bacterium]